jgi:tetratricopeptide (TPR) repeat protein
MTRNWVLTLLLSAALAGVVLAWNEVRQEREFRRLIALGDEAMARDQSSLAIEVFSGAVAVKPDSMLGYLKRGDTYRRRGELSAALRDLRRAAEIDPAAPRPKELLGDVNAALGQFDRAAEEYGAFLALDDRSARVLYKLALARYRAGQAAAAMDPLRQALAIDDKLAEAHYLLAMCSRERKRDSDALQSLRRAISINPAFADARSELADLLAALGRGREAIQQLEALAALEPSRAERLIAVGLAYASAGRPDTAILTLGRAAEHHPQEPAVYAALGRVWLDTAETRLDPAAVRKAIDALQKFSSVDNASGELLALYGRALFLSGDVVRSERVLIDATARLPVDPAAFLYLSAASQRLARPGAARAALDRYATLAGPEAGNVRDRLSDVLELQKQLRVTRAGSTPDQARRISTGIVERRPSTRASDRSYRDTA